GRAQAGHLASVDRHAAGIGADEGGRDREQARLAGAARAGDPGHGAGPSGQGRAVHGGDARVAGGGGEGGVVESDHRLRPRAVRGAAEVTDRRAKAAPARPSAIMMAAGARVVNGFRTKGRAAPAAAPSSDTIPIPTPTPI